MSFLSNVTICGDLIGKWPDEVMKDMEEMDWLIAIFALITLILFFVMIYVVITVGNKYPMLKGRGYNEVFIFIILGTVSSFQNLADEFLWFDKDFYDLLWKPSKLCLLIAAFVALIFAFQKFYKFSDRLFGET